MKSLLFLLFVLSCCCVPLLASFIADWTKIGAADERERIGFWVALKQRNTHKLEELLYAVSDPKSPWYGKQVSKEEIDALVNPPKEEHDFVVNFFTSNRPDISVTSYGDALKIVAPVRDVADIFNANFFKYRHGPSGHTSIRADHKGGIVIPSSIRPYVYMVTELTSFPIIQRQRKLTNLKSESDAVMDTQYGYFAASTLRRLYNIPDKAVATNPETSQCALEFYPEGCFSYPDYATYAKLADEVFTNFTQIVGPFKAGEWGNVESQLDVQILGYVGSGAENWFWTIENGWAYEMAVQIFNAGKRPKVFSISYGWPEVLTCNSAVVQADCGMGDNADYINRTNLEFAKLGVLRISVITCSQDEGAPSEANRDCTNQTHPVFGIFPGSSPYALSVSGTTAVPDGGDSNPTPQPPICKRKCSNSTTEHACMPNNTLDQWTTGGGFSEFTVLPAYQAAFVQAFIKSDAKRPPSQYFSASNRGYPDISAIGSRVLIINVGDVVLAEGTSASTPIIAGIVSLLNDARLNAGKSALGFLNPLLYQMAADKPEAFNDVTFGSNNCAIYECCKYGYGAIKGWDAVTGLGTPNFQKMLDYVNALP